MSSPKLLALAALLAGLAPPTARAQSPILVELFTSQGCSSCPPAEKWLNTKGMELFRQGRILPLAFHVDYWNSLGWNDPFSSPLFTERQRRYGETLSGGSIYTPQMVVAGRTGFVGSDSRQAMDAVNDPENIPSGKPIPLKLVPVKNGAELEVDLSGQNTHDKIWLAVFEDRLTTKVERGENSGETLEGNFVVRRLEEVKVTPGAAKVRLALPLGNASSRQGAVVFTQDGSSLRIHSVGSLFPLTVPSPL